MGRCSYNYCSDLNQTIFHYKLSCFVVVFVYAFPSLFFRMSVLSAGYTT